jgi:transposase-like protein
MQSRAILPKMRRTYSDAEKAHALDLYQTEGPAQAALATGIPKGTILSWAHRAGLQSDCIAEMGKARQAASLTLEARKAVLAGRLTEVAEKAVERQLELIEEGNLRDVVGAGTRAIHDTLLLTGQATERHAVEESQVDAEIRKLSAEISLGAA